MYYVNCHIKNSTILGNYRSVSYHHPLFIVVYDILLLVIRPYGASFEVIVLTYQERFHLSTHKCDSQSVIESKAKEHFIHNEKVDLLSPHI